MKNSEINSQSNDSILINDEIREYLKETAEWGKFLAILGFIGLGLMEIPIIARFFLNVFTGNVYGSGYFKFLGVNILCVLFYFYQINCLYKFSVEINKGLNSKDQELFTSGFKNLKSLFKFQGIVIIVSISFCILMFLYIIANK